MKNASSFVITISRQLGSGGAYIGQQLAAKLNAFYADREIIGKAAQQLSVLEEDLESREEKMLSFWQSFIRSFAVAPVVYVPPQIIDPTDRKLFKTESEIIARIAKERSAVIIGRCGFYILREYPNHVSIFLHGDITFRNGRIQKLYNISEKVAGEMIAQSDKERARYNHTFTGKEWADARQYNLSIDTGKTGIDKSVEVILKYLNLI
ncbi:MAG: AAA family ATPase [Smithellaceae bacterium]